MLKKILLALATSTLAFSAATSVHAVEINFNPDENCTLVLKQQSDVAGIWSFGYLSSLSGQTRVVDNSLIKDLTDDLADGCLNSPDASFISLVEILFDVNDGDEDETARAELFAPISQDPQALLEFMATEGASLAELMVLLKPEPGDVRTVFPEPMASNLIEFYDEMFGDRLANEEFPDPFVVESSDFTTTLSLAEHPMLDDISGGFQRVLDKFQVDIPFGTVRIGFPSVDDSMKLHGMMYVNGHWVLMSRPWRGIED